jgi:hypothetical protein
MQVRAVTSLGNFALELRWGISLESGGDQEPVMVFEARGL